MRAGVGASIHLEKRGGAGGGSRAAGAFWYVSGGPVTWLGEMDETRGEDRAGRPSTN